MTIKKLLPITAVVALLTLVSVPKASADSFNLNIINCNCLSTGSSDGGTVTLTLVNGEVKVVVTLGDGVDDFLDFHQNNAFDEFVFDNSGGAVTLDATGVGATSGLTLATTSPKANPEDGAGHNFQEFIDGIACPGPCTGGDTGVSTITFYLKGTGLTLSQFENTNGGLNNADFAAAVTNTRVGSCTGVVSGGNGTSQSTASPSNGGANGSCNSTTVTPEPGSIYLLLITGLGLILAYKPLKASLFA